MSFEQIFKNPTAPEEVPLREPAEIITEIRQLDEEAESMLENIETLLSK